MQIYGIFANWQGSDRKKFAKKAKCLIYKAVTQSQKTKVLIYKAVTQNEF